MGRDSYGLMNLLSRVSSQARNFRMLSLSNNNEAQATIRLAEEILWKRLPSNSAVMGKLESRQLYNEQSLPEMRSLLTHLGISQEDLTALKAIHIAGSKGKGSTAAFVERALRAAGYKTAMFTSPHLIHPRERICLDGIHLDLLSYSKNVIDLYERLITFSGGRLPGFFRFMTLLALKQMVGMKRKDPSSLDVAIIEVGMGGRYDATNVIDSPSVTAVTSLALEHVKTLGPDLRHIAHHKIGIAKCGIPCFTVPQPVDAVEVFIAECDAIGAPFSFISDIDVSRVEKESLGIDGSHQIMNAALAIKVVRNWLESHGLPPLGYDMVKKALSSTRWPGRHQIYQDQNRQSTWCLDGAHTIESIQFALDWFLARTNSPDLRISRRILVFHCTHDRDPAHLLAPIFNELQTKPHCFDQVYFAKPDLVTDAANECDNSDLSFHKQMCLLWRERAPHVPCSALTTEGLVREAMQPNDILFCTGSLYLIGNIMEKLNIEVSLG